MYKKYSKPPKSPVSLNLDEFMAICGELYQVVLTDDTITFSQMSNDNPFRTILLRNIYGIEKFEYHMALVSSSYILFFNRDEVDVTVHFKPESTNWIKRFYDWCKYRLMRKDNS
ncbi:hypothetical protein B5G10_05670 [Barnesiella sp. An55]|nr:hypothetical protein B5G10_05670 [Barnesiella sp. An55]